MLKLLGNRLMPRIDYFLNKSSQLPAPDYQTHLVRINSLQNFIKFWKRHELNLIIYPSFGCHTHLHGKAYDLELAEADVIVWKVLDMVTGC